MRNINRRVLYVVALLLIVLFLIHVDFRKTGDVSKIHVSAEDALVEHKTSEKNKVKINTDNTKSLLETSIVHHVETQSSANDTDNEVIPDVQLQNELSKESMTMYSFSAKQQKIYLNTIQAVSTLIANFLQNKEFAAEISIIKSNKMPKNVESIIDEMETYTNSLSKQDTVRLFPSEGFVSGLLGHFVSISKMPEDSIKREAAFRIINDKIYIITEYFFSDQFFNQILHND